MGYLDHNFHVPNTLRNQVQKISRAFRRALLDNGSRQPFVDGCNDPHWQVPKLDTMIRSYPVEAT